MAAVLEERPVEAEPLDRRRMNLVFVTILVGMLLAALDQTIVATALPTIVGDLGGAGHLSWVVSSYLLADTIATVLAGKFGDQFGRKLLFQVSAAVFVVASAHVRPGRQHELADRLAGRPGVRRRVPDGDRDRRHRRHHPAARARQVPRCAGRGLRGDDGAGPAPGRPAHRPPVLAVDVLHQPAGRHRGHRAGRVHHAVHQAAWPALDRLPRHRLRLPRRGRADARALVGRHAVPVDLADDRLDGRRVPGVPRRLRSRRTARHRTDPPAASLHVVGLQRVRGARLHRGVRDARRDDVPAHVPAVRARRRRPPSRGCRPCRWSSAC